MALTHKRAAFAREYLIDLNATQAAIRAGYAPGSARVTGTRLLADAAIRAEVERAQQERAQDTRLSAQMVLDGLRSIAEGQGPENARVRAYELLGKHLGMFTDKTEHSGGISIRVIRE
jgi:phage terminase small subunit